MNTHAKRVASALAAALLILFGTSVAAAGSLPTDTHLEAMVDNEGNGNGNSGGQSKQGGKVCFPDHKVDGAGSISGSWGSASWGGDDRSLELNVNSGWTVEICVKAATGVYVFTANASTPDQSYPHGISHVSWRNAVGSASVVGTSDDDDKGKDKNKDVATPANQGVDRGNGPAPKVTLCHRTGSSSNPYVKITISENGLNGHGHHDGDIILTSADGNCPSTPNVSVTTNTDTEVDVETNVQQDDTEVNVTGTTTTHVNLVSDLRIFLNGVDVTTKVLNGEIDLNIGDINRLVEARLLTSNIDITSPALNILLRGTLSNGVLDLTTTPVVQLQMDGFDISSVLGIQPGTISIIESSPALQGVIAVPATTTAPSVTAAAPTDDTSAAAGPLFGTMPSTTTESTQATTQTPAPANAGNAGLLGQTQDRWAIGALAMLVLAGLVGLRGVLPRAD